MNNNFNNQLPGDDEIKEYLYQSSSSSDNNYRKSCEQQIKMLSQQHPEHLIKMLTTILVNSPQNEISKENLLKDSLSRRMAATVFKNLIHQKVFSQFGDPNFQQSLWFTFSEQLRSGIKEGFLQILGQSPQDIVNDRQLLNAICLCISAIAAIEVPMQLQLDFVPMMTSHGAQNENMFFKRAALNILGLTVERLKGQHFSHEEIVMIWEVCLSNIPQQPIDLSKNQGQEDLILTVAKSIDNLCESSEIFFNDDQKKNAIMQGIFCLLKIENNSIQEASFFALDKIIKKNVRTLNQNDLEMFFEIYKSFVSLPKDEENLNLIKQAIEIWTTLFQAQLDFQKVNRQFVLVENFPLSQDFSASLFMGLKEQCEVEEDSTNNGAADAANELENIEDTSLVTIYKEAISLLAEINKDLIFQLALDFMSQLENTDQNFNWKTKQAQLIALICVVGPQNAEKVQKVFDPQLTDWLIHQASNEYSARVRNTSAQLISQIMNVSFSVFTLNETFPKYLEWLKKIVEHDNSKNAIIAIQGFGTFCKQLCEVKQVHNLNDYVPQVLQISLARAMSDEMINNGTMPVIVDAINDILESIDSQSLYEMFVAIGEQIDHEIDILLKNKASCQNPETIINNLCGLMQVIIVRLGGRFTSLPLREKVFNKLENLCSMTSYRTGAILILNASINVLSCNEIQGHAETIIRLVEHTVQNQDGQFTSCDQRLSIGLLQDLTSCMSKKFNQYLRQVMNILTPLLQNSEISSDIKLISISAIGDICLISEKDFQEYLSPTMQLLLEAAQQSLTSTFDSNLDAEDRALIQTMRKTLTECFLSIVNGIKEKSQSLDQKIDEILWNIYVFLDRLVKLEDFESDFELARNILDLFTDILVHNYEQSKTNISGNGAPSANYQGQSPFSQQLREGFLKQQTHLAVRAKLDIYAPELEKSEESRQTLERFVESVSQTIIPFVQEAV